MIPFLDLARINEAQAEPLAAAAERVIRGGWYVRGNEVAAFEEEFADYCGVKYCVGVGNGLDALTLMLRAAVISGDLKTGDDVLVPANTYIATVLAITQAGLSPVLTEADDATFNISPASAATADKNGGVRAIMAVHLYGRVAPMRELRALCRDRGWLLFEDAAQAHGATCHGVKVGAFGDAAGFSFYPSKNLGAFGDAGAVTTNNLHWAEIVRTLGNYGAKEKYKNAYAGVNSRLDEMQAAFLRVKLPLLDAENSRRRHLAERYLSEIRHPDIHLPAPPENAESHVWHLFVVRSRRREELMAHLKKNGVGTMIHYPIPPHRQKAYADTPLAECRFPKSEKMAEEILSLPLSPVLTNSEADKIIGAVNSLPHP